MVLNIKGVKQSLGNDAVDTHYTGWAHGWCIRSTGWFTRNSACTEEIKGLTASALKDLAAECPGHFLRFDTVQL